MKQFIILLVILLLSVSVQTQRTVFNFDEVTETAIMLMRRPVIVKFDAPHCAQCNQLDQIWDLAGESMSSGSVWRVNCANDHAKLCAKHGIYDDHRTPLFEAWDGELWQPYAGPSDIEGLIQWIQSSLLLQGQRKPDPRPVTLQLQQASTEWFGKGLLEKFPIHHYTYIALVRALSPVVDETRDSSIVHVGCGYGGFLMEAWRKADHHQLSSHCVEATSTSSSSSSSSSSSPSTQPEPHLEQFYATHNLLRPDAELPKSDIVSTFEVAETIPVTHARHFVRLLTRHRPRLVFFHAAATSTTPPNNLTPHTTPDASDDQSSSSPDHENSLTLPSWVSLFQAEGYVLDTGTVKKTLSPENCAKPVLTQL